MLYELANRYNEVLTVYGQYYALLQTLFNF